MAENTAKKSGTTAPKRTTQTNNPTDAAAEPKKPQLRQPRQPRKKQAPTEPEQQDPATAAAAEPKKPEPQPKVEDSEFAHDDEEGRVYLGKYAKRHRKARERGLRHDPDWRYLSHRFVASAEPRSAGSVMGALHRIAKEAGGEGILGQDLAEKLRHTPDIANRSKYCSGDLPPVGWAEDYVNGALSSAPKVLDFHKTQTGGKEEAEAPGEENS